MIALTLVGVALAAGYALLQTPKYTTTTKVFISTSSAASVTDLSTGTSFSQQIARSLAEVVTTSLVLKPVVEQLDLDTTPEQLATHVSASAQLNTTILDITVTDSDPVAAAEIANSITANLIATVPQLAPSSADGGESPVRVTVAQPAVVPEKASSPNVPLYLVLGGLLGLALAAGIAVLREVLDSRVRGEHDVRALTDAPVIGGIAIDPKTRERPLIVHDDPRNPRAEAFRTLRTNLQFLDFAEKSRTFVMTSALEGEGKSTTTANLAIALSESGHRVLVIEGDLRQPKIAEYLGAEGGAGLTDVVVGRARVADGGHQWGRKALYVLPAGTMPPNPSELLGSAAMRRLLDDLEKEFGFILIDTAPLLPVTDAAVLSKLTSGAIIITAAGRTQRAQLAHAIDSLSRVGAHLHGIVLNMLPTRGPDAYGQATYGYYGEAEMTAANN